ncbi:hypothetical protein NLJ89_g8019 [Agrocybe chaxingu]|uniref:Fungal-type protein kinase domain-containing protein n=1 Tax=Agrocybe chaxingu TaxID=84603 RepID=A0A9W8JV77_9AGAR|nr:hypothetical protein NLJ89_g8019 [Agrocybe chaxingu]
MVKNTTTGSGSSSMSSIFDPISLASHSSHELHGGTVYYKHTPRIEDERNAFPSNDSTTAGLSIMSNYGSYSDYATSNTTVSRQQAKERRARAGYFPDCVRKETPSESRDYKPGHSSVYKIGDDLSLKLVSIGLDAPSNAATIGAAARCHIRMEALVLLSLSDFKEPKEIMEIVADAFEGHRRTNVKSGYIHGAITDETIVIDAHTGFGMLADWDLAGDNVNGLLSRSGTRFFESIGLLKEPRRKATLQDDLESFFYVALYSALKFAQHNRCACDTRLIIQAVFENQAAGDCTMPGYTKRQMIRDWGYIGPDFRFKKNLGLNMWHRGAVRAFEEYYSWLDRWQRAAADIWGREDEASARPPRGTILYDHCYLAALFDEAISTPDEVDSVAPPAAASARVVRPWEEAGWEQLTPVEKFAKVPSTEYRGQLWWEKAGLPLWKEIVLPEPKALPVKSSSEQEDNDEELYVPDDGEIEDDDPYVPYEPYID